MTITAPSAAEELIPMMLGSARGFLNNICKAAPPVPSAMPVRMHIMVRGMRNSKKIIVSIVWFF